MSSQSSGGLATLYQRRIGQPRTNGEVTGYWLFLAGVLLGLLGILLFFPTDAATEARGIAYALVALAPTFMLLGAVVRFPLRRAATVLGYLGAFASFGAIVWFLSIFPSGWSTVSGHTEIILLYSLGIGVIGLAGAIVPLATDPIRTERDQQRRQMASMQATADRQDAALEAATDREQDHQETIDALKADIAAMSRSQARFEVYADAGGKHRWRLRHRNGNIIATSGQGYTRRHNAHKGMQSVRRNAFGATTLVVDADADTEPDLPDPDETFEPVTEQSSKATFEVYTDAGQEYRWRLRHDNGNIIADSAEGYSAKQNAQHSITRLMEYVGPADYLWFDPAGIEVYRDRGEGWRWRLIHRNGNILADSGESYTRRHDARRAVDRLQSAIEDMNTEVYEDDAGEYRWRLMSTNGRIVADSAEGYAKQQGARQALDRAQELLPAADTLDIGQASFELFVTNDDEHRWRLRHRNGNILADSGEGYASRSNARDGIERVKRHAPNAEISMVDDES